MLRRCSTCQKLLPSDEFYRHPRGNKGLTRRCRKCHSRKSYASRKRSKRPHARRDYDYSIRLKTKYGTTPFEVGIILSDQKGVCAICGEKESSRRWAEGLESRLAVDHDHKTGKIRGLLCGRCNTGLGMFRDNVDIMIEAIVYLKRNSDCD